MTTSNSKWSWTGRWLLAFLGFPIGGGITYLVIGAIDSPLKGLAGGAIAGACIGGAQWLALRSQRDIDGKWIVISSAGLAAGVALSTALLGTDNDVNSVIGRAALTGISLGTAQAYSLQHSRGAALLWALAAAAGYTIAWPVTRLVIRDNIQMGYVVFGSSGAILFQIITYLATLRMPPKRS